MRCSSPAAISVRPACARPFERRGERSTDIDADQSPELNAVRHAVVDLDEVDLPSPLVFYELGTKKNALMRNPAASISA